MKIIDCSFGLVVCNPSSRSRLGSGSWLIESITVEHWEVPKLPTLNLWRTRETLHYWYARTRTCIYICYIHILYTYIYIIYMYIYICVYHIYHIYIYIIYD